jgi:hypothetical protein
VLYKTPLTQIATNHLAGSEMMNLMGVQLSQHHPVHRLKSTFSTKWLKSTASFEVNFLLLVDPAEDSTILSKVTNCLPVTQCHIPQNPTFFRM